MAQSECICVGGGPEHWSVLRRSWRHSAELPIWSARAQCVARPGFFLERLLLDEDVPAERTVEVAPRGTGLQYIQPPKLCDAERRLCRHSRETLHADWVRGAYLHD